MKHQRTIIAGLLLGLLLFVIGGFIYRTVHHSFELADTVIVLGEPVEMNWRTADELPNGRGVSVLSPLASTVKLGDGNPSKDANADMVHVTGDKVQFVSLDSDETLPIEAELVSRRIVNRFGTELYSWRCTVKGAIAPVDKDYYLHVDGTGGGDVGPTVAFEVTKIDRFGFTLKIVECLWSSKTRECDVRFRIDDEGTITAAAD